MCYKLLMKNKQKVFVGVSGGVDSSVALALLKKEGYDVTGVFLKVWHPDFLPCDWKEERRSAMRVCAVLNVPFMTLDCEDEYKKDVVDYMISEYSVGRIPNPDVFCNKYVKFGVFLKKSKEMGADFIATGHYAIKEEKSGKFLLKESVDKNKDQSYFLYTLDQNQLASSFFPVGNKTKNEVRKLAKKFNLPTFDKKDSQGLCFIGKVDMKDFLSHYIKTKKGKVLNSKNEEIGYHDGSIFFSIGQRHGFVITKKTPKDGRYFVISKDLKKNTITVSDNEDEIKNIFGVKEVFLKKIHFINKEPKLPIKVLVRIRYRQEKQKAEILKLENGYKVIFNKTQTGVSEGQSLVIYSGEVCLGGGIIERA